MLDAEAEVDAGRRAYAAAEWDAALERLTLVRTAGVLDVDDLAIMAECAWWLGRVPDSLALSEEVFRTYCELGRTPDAAMAAMQLALRWVARGDITIGLAWVHRADRILQDTPDDPAHAYMLYLQTSVGMTDTGETWSDTSVARMKDLARQFAHPAVQALSMVVTAMADLRRGDPRRGFALLDEAMLPVLAQQISPEWAGDIYCTTIHVCHELGDFRRMEDWTTATEQWCRRFGGEAVYNGICRMHRLELRSVRGDWADTEDLLAREGARLAGGSPWVAGEGFYQLGEIRRRRGDLAGAREAYALARSSGIDPQPGEALLDLREGRPDAAWDAIVESLASRDRVSRARLLRAGVEISLALGRHSDAEALAAEARATADHFQSRGFRAWAAHAEGMLALALGDPQRALVALRTAASTFRADRQPYESATVLISMSRAHELAGEPGLAGRAQQEAVRILTALGAHVDEVDLPREPSPGTLTSREAQVLACVARGLSNRDVGALLFISDKTVSRHLANVYSKIGVSSRTAAAAWWHEHGVDTGIAQR